MSNVLLARYAECLFWLARYVERAENLARILDVNETFSRDSHGGQNWLSIVQLNSDEKSFFAKHKAATATTVLQFYISDAGNPNSIVSAIRFARENARTLRPLISTEMWVQLNVFYNRVLNVAPAEMSLGNLARLLGMIKEACQTHTGITEGTFYRDQGWFFCQMGRYIERADQTTRLLDIKYHLLLPRPSDVGTTLDVSQWNALLRSAAGYHAFRRIHTSTITPGRVAGFLLLNQVFPRSVARCVAETTSALTELRARYGLRTGAEAAELLDELTSLLSERPIGEILTNGLHEFIDTLQFQLNQVTRHLGHGFFGDTTEAPSSRAVSA